MTSTNSQVSPAPADVPQGKCLGLILRSQLLLILRHKVFVAHGDQSRTLDSLPDLLPLERFRDAAHRRPHSLVSRRYEQGVKGLGLCEWYMRGVL